jgi:hypothetical protein
MRKIAGIVMAASVALVQGTAARAQEGLTTPLLTLSLAQGPRTILATVPDPSPPPSPPAAAPASGPGPATQPASVRDVDARVTLEPSAQDDATAGMRLSTGLRSYLTDLTAIPTTQNRDDVELLRSAHTGGTSFFDTLGNFFDVGAEDVRPWSTTTSVHLLAGQQAVGALVPFASFAREEAALQDRDRIGLGGGMAYYVAPGASIASEMLYFGDRGNSNDTWERETRFSLQFSIQF